MSSDLDKWWNDSARLLRHLKGYCELTPEQAEAELKKATPIPLSKGDIDSMVRRVLHGETSDCEHTLQYSWMESEVDEALEEELLQLNRNAGDESEVTKHKLNTLRNQLLNDDDDA